MSRVPSERADVSPPCQTERGLTPPVALKGDRGGDEFSRVTPPTHVGGSLGDEGTRGMEFGTEKNVTQGAA
jgi:hypothetical protein